jgi:hypothetical protein
MMRERQGCRSVVIPGDMVTWVIDVSVSRALGAWTVAVSTVLGDGRTTACSRGVSACLPSQFGRSDKIPRGE